MGLATAVEKEEESGAESDDESLDAIGSELCDLAEVPEDRRDAFVETLKSFVKTCLEEG